MSVNNRIGNVPVGNEVGLSTGEMHDDDLSHAISEVPPEHAPLRITVTKQKPKEDVQTDATPDYDPFQAAADRVKAGVTTHPGGLLEKVPDAAIETLAEPIRKIRGLLDSLNRQYSPEQYSTLNEESMGPGYGDLKTIRRSTTISDSDPQPTDYSVPLAMALTMPGGRPSRKVTEEMLAAPKPNEFQQFPYVDHGIPNLNATEQIDLDQLHHEATSSGWWREYQAVHKVYTENTYPYGKSGSAIEDVFSHATEQEQFKQMLDQLDQHLTKTTPSGYKVKPILDTTEDIMAAIKHVLDTPEPGSTVGGTKAIKNIPINESISDAIGAYMKQPSPKAAEDIDKALTATKAKAATTWEELSKIGKKPSKLDAWGRVSMYSKLKDQLHDAIDEMAQKVYSNIYKGKLAKHLKEFDWEDFKTPKTLSSEGVATRVDPAYMKEIGFNPDALLFKGGWKHYPNHGEIPNPENKPLEKGFFLADDPKVADHYGSGITMYVARPIKPVMVDWKAATGESYYSPNRMHTIIEAARAKDADMIVVIGIDDIGAKKQNQYIVLDPSILRAPTAAFDPTKLHINHVMMSLGGVITPVVLFSHGDPAKAGEIEKYPVVAKQEMKPQKLEDDDGFDAANNALLELTQIMGKHADMGKLVDKSSENIDDRREETELEASKKAFSRSLMKLMDDDYLKRIKSKLAKDAGREDIGKK